MSKSKLSEILDGIENGYIPAWSFLDQFDIDIQDENGRTLLMVFAKGGYADYVSLCLKKGAEVNKEAWNNWTALIHASYEGHLEVLKLLCEAGADVSIRTQICGHTALEKARIIANLCRQLGGECGVWSAKAQKYQKIVDYLETQET